MEIKTIQEIEKEDKLINDRYKAVSMLETASSDLDTISAVVTLVVEFFEEHYQAPYKKEVATIMAMQMDKYRHVARLAMDKIDSLNGEIIKTVEEL